MNKKEIISRFEEIGHVIIPNIFTELDAQKVLADLERAREGSLLEFELNLTDSNDVCNRVYSSKRSPLNYCYLRTEKAHELNKKVTRRL